MGRTENEIMVDIRSHFYFTTDTLDTGNIEAQWK